ncbi:MAG: bifunctional glutamate N-acetyltransferase/amino-acid acetyltransferase ArgJ [Sciscionella sp.]
MSEVATDAGITAAAGFRAAGVAAGIKTSGAKDLALVVNDGPNQCAAGVFTTNVIKAAPVLWSRQVLDGGKLHAVVLNSGGANACTGPAGFQDTHATAEHVAARLGVGAIEVAVCSTGLIGELLPMPAVRGGIDAAHEALAADAAAGRAAATAVLTTDSRPKQAHLRHTDGWSIGGFVKGAGMLAPNLATMLCVLGTDADLEHRQLDSALRSVTRLTFDRLDVDGGTSTNDTVLLLSSGRSGMVPELAEFTAALRAVCGSLVLQLLGDAEGATKEITLTVRGARSEDDAVRIGRTVAEDNLVKTAIFGNDPNWGRIAMALGRARADIDPQSVEIIVNGTTLYAAGASAADRSAVDLAPRVVDIVIDLHLADAQATVLTTDLSHGYVEENSAYSS